MDYKKALKLLDGITVTKYGIHFDIRKLWLDGKAKLLEIKRTSFYSFDKEHELRNLKEKNNWITFDDLVSADFYIDKQLHCDLRIYSGNSFDGSKRYGDFTHLLFKLPMSFINKIKDDIKYSYKQFAIDSYHDYLQSVADKWVNKFIKDTVG
jgi:hypothetical protein